MSSDHYVSTRGGVAGARFDQILLDGLAADGGLYVPESWPDFSALKGEAGALAYAVLCERVLAPFVGDALDAADVRAAAQRAAAAFDAPDVVPLVELEPGLWLLELFHGPTLAFKDCAMQLIAPLTSAALARAGERLLLLTATSGDTGAAAVEAFADLAGVDLVVLHPVGRVSEAQRRQMTTRAADNVLNLAVEGDFDDCQAFVKRLAREPRVRERMRVSTVNSINWCRLAGQIPYYLRAAARLGGAARFVVPTGNLGDAFAGWAARQAGAGVSSLLAAVNANDALARALNDGVYARAPAKATASVAMDVQAPSNFERLFFEASGRDAAATKAFFEGFAETGRAEVPDAIRRRAAADVAATSVSEAETAAEIKRVFSETGRHVCPHTAVALSAARGLVSEGPSVVVLATAHPGKFPDSVGAAAGTPPPTPDALARLADLPERYETIAADYEAVATRVIAQVS